MTNCDSAKGNSSRLNRMLFTCKSFFILAVVVRVRGSHAAYIASAKDYDQGQNAEVRQGLRQTVDLDEALQADEAGYLEFFLYAGAKVLCILVFML